MGLGSWNSQPFNIASQIDQSDVFVTNGTTNVTLTYKGIDRMGSTVQYSSVLKYLYTGGFTKSGTNTLTFDTAPVAGLQGTANGLGNLISTTYDRSIVNGVSNSNIAETPFYVGNITNINLVYYKPIAPASGITITLVNNITSVTPDLSWVQLACSNPTTGAALTYTATGVPLFTASLAGFGTITASGTATYGNTVTIGTPNTGFSFFPGDFVLFNIGQSNQEIVQLGSITTIAAGASQTLTFNASFNFNHSVGEPLYSCARKFWLKQTTPINAANNTSKAYYNISFLVQADENPRP